MLDFPNLIAGTLLGFSGSIIAGSVIQPIFGEATSYHLVKYFSVALRALGKHSPLQGSWTQSWMATNSTNFPQENQSRLELYQIGNRISGNYTSETNSGRVCKYRLKGHVTNNYLFGVWRDADSEGYFGSFKVRISESKDKAEGMWVGSKDNSKISAGIWHWDRISRG